MLKVHSNITLTEISDCFYWFVVVVCNLNHGNTEKIVQKKMKLYFSCFLGTLRISNGKWFLLNFSFARPKHKIKPLVESFYRKEKKKLKSKIKKCGKNKFSFNLKILPTAINQNLFPDLASFFCVIYFPFIRSILLRIFLFCVLPIFPQFSFDQFFYGCCSCLFTNILT